MPGKIGDAFHQYPVAYQWHLATGEKLHLGLDQRMLRPLAPLFASQPAVEKVYLLPGIDHYMMGGQPFDFGFPPEAYKYWDKIYHLGFKEPADKPITLYTKSRVDYPINTSKLRNTRCIFGSRPPSPRNLLVLHGARTDQWGNLPHFWDALHLTYPELRAEFEEIVFVGTSSNRRVWRKWEGASEFDDAGDWIKLVDFMQDARLVMGVGSAMIALAGALKVPSIRIHDYIEGFPNHKVFSNLGPHQWNLGEGTDYRKEILKCLELLGRWPTNSASSTSSSFTSRMKSTPLSSEELVSQPKS